MSSMKPFLFLGMMLCSIITSAGDDSWKCQWFGWGCDEGAQNQTLIDFGRQRTVESFLFFDSDSAHIEQTIELSFSARSASMGDYVDLQWEGEVPAGTSVSLNGKNVLSPNWHRIEAQTQPWQGVLAISIPPSGNDHEISGGLKVKPYGFERAGSQDLTRQPSKPLTMVRVQGEVDSDWHWFKRLVFWFVVFVATAIALWKFIIAPARFGRFKIARIVMTTKEKGSETSPSQKVFRNLNRGLFRRPTRIIRMSSKRMVPNPWSEFMHGKSLSHRLHGLGAVEVEVKPHKTTRRKGAAIQVRWKIDGKWDIPRTIYRKERRKEDKNVEIPVSAGKVLMLTFDLNR